LLGQPDPESMAREIIEHGLNVRQVEALAQEQKARPAKNTKRRGGARKDADTAAVERRLSDALGLAVDIEHRGKGGVLRIRYRDVEQLDEVVRRLERGG
jgi:ParB family chromosome partitioning protein